MKKLLSIIAALTFSASVQAQTVNLRLAHEFPVTHPFSQGLEVAVKYITDTSAGKIKIQLLPASQLGSGREIVQQISSGSIDMGFTGSGMLANWHKPIGIFEAPFIAKDWSTWQKMFESSAALAVQQQLADKANIQRVGSAWYAGQRHFTTRNKPISRPEDLKGLKIRVPEVPLFLDMVRGLGAQPTPMPLAEVYLALQTGVIDGQENPLPTINGAKLQEVQKHISLTGHVISGLWPVTNTKSWAKLSAADKKIILDGMQQGAKHSDNIFFTQEENLVKEFQSRGVVFTQPDKAAFAKAMQAVYDKNEDNWGKGLLAKLQSVK